MTAIEWFAKELIRRFKRSQIHYTGSEWSFDMIKKLSEQAKEMEKQKQDEFAIGFAEWLVIRYNEDIIFDEYTSKELLEIYKKEKGL